ncbi:uncharacterized protein LOC114606889 [Podarcis muralis]
MEEGMYLTSEEHIPMSSRSWLSKKKRNSVFPAAESQNKTEAWVQTVIPSSSQVTEESSRSDAEPKSQTTISSSIPLPGSIMDYMDELQMHPPCAAKSAAIVEEAGCGEIGQGQSWLNKLSFNKNKLSFVTCLNERKGNKTAQKGHPSAPRVLFHDNQLDGCLSKEEQLYIPYRLAKLYITKIAKDMHQMKIGYTKAIKELEHVGKENQEQAMMALKNQYSNKMKNLRAQLEAYQEAVDKQNQYWQDTTKKLKEENRILRQEKEDLANQITLQKEKWGDEKAWLLKSTTQKLDCLHNQHTLTIEELQKSRVNLEKVEKIVDFQMDLPCDQRRALIISDEITEKGITDHNAGVEKSNVTTQESETTEPAQRSTSVVVEMEEAHNGLPQKKLLLEVKATLELVKGSLHKRETEISELLQNGHWCNSQITDMLLTESTVY